MRRDEVERNWLAHVQDNQLSRAKRIARTKKRTHDSAVIDCLKGVEIERG